MKLKLIYLDCFESKLKDKTYCVYRFLDPNSLQVITGTDLNLSLEEYKLYDCQLVWKSNKLKVISIV